MPNPVGCGGILLWMGMGCRDVLSSAWITKTSWLTERSPGGPLSKLVKGKKWQEKGKLSATRFHYTSKMIENWTEKYFNWHLNCFVWTDLKLQVSWNFLICFTNIDLPCHSSFHFLILSHVRSKGAWCLSAGGRGVAKGANLRALVYAGPTKRSKDSESKTTICTLNMDYTIAWHYVLVKHSSATSLKLLKRKLLQL